MNLPEVLLDSGAEVSARLDKLLEHEKDIQLSLDFKKSLRVYAAELGYFVSQGAITQKEADDLFWFYTRHELIQKGAIAGMTVDEQIKELVFNPSIRALRDIADGLENGEDQEEKRRRILTIYLNMLSDYLSKCEN